MDGAGDAGRGSFAVAAAFEEEALVVREGSCFEAGFFCDFEGGGCSTGAWGFSWAVF